MKMILKVIAITFQVNRTSHCQSRTLAMKTEKFSSMLFAINMTFSNWHSRGSQNIKAMSRNLMKGLFPHKRARKSDLAAIMRVRQVANFDRIFKKDKGNESD
jgi:hypothetical protein